jgi:hypothetical protein
MNMNNSKENSIVAGVLSVFWANIAHAQPVTLHNPIPKVGTLQEFIAILILIMQWVVTPFLVIGLVYGGFMIVTAGGDEKKLEIGKSIVIWMIVGGFILLGAQVIAGAVQGTVDPFLNAVK